LEVALRTLAAVRRRRPDAVLHVTGRLTWARDERSARATADGLAAELGISEHVRYLGPFSQRQAPGILRNAHLMLHTKYNDPCPGAVIEAMACGLPIVYSASGGVPELVGDAGVGVPAPVDFERDHPPDPEALADAVLAVAERREELGARARQRAEEHFDLRPWVERHRAIFERLVA
jgi:glycosyltransferase involved in cell wall biosynthesis